MIKYKEKCVWKMKGGRQREKIFQQEEGVCAGPLIITDTLHYPRRNVHADVSMCTCVLVHNDRRV